MRTSLQKSKYFIAFLLALSFLSQTSCSKKEDEAAVTKLLRGYHIEYLLSATCPECGSNSFTHVAKPKVANYLTAILTWLVSSYAVAPEYIYQCGNCGYECESLPDPKEEFYKEENNTE